MTHSPDGADSTESTRSEVTEADGPVNGADAVPDKTADTPAKGAEFEEEGTEDSADDTSEVPGAGADTSIRDQDRP